MAHLDKTTECLVAMNFFVFNMEKKLRLLFALFLKTYFYGNLTRENYAIFKNTVYSVNPNYEIIFYRRLNCRVIR